MTLRDKEHPQQKAPEQHRAHDAVHGPDAVDGHQQGAREAGGEPGQGQQHHELPGHRTAHRRTVRRLGNRRITRAARERDGHHARARKRQQADRDVGCHGLQAEDRERHRPRDDAGAAPKEHAAPRPQLHVHLGPEQKQDGPAKASDQGQQAHNRQGHPRADRERQQPRRPRYFNLKQ